MSELVQITIELMKGWEGLEKEDVLDGYFHSGC